MMNFTELWRPIVNVPSIYQVSNEGNVRKEVCPGQYELLRKSMSDGYLTVCFEGRQFKIHKLVADAFLPNPDPKRYTLIRFKDGNKQNPVSANLEWATFSEVNESPHKLGTKNSPLILCVDTNQIFSTCIAAASYFNMPKDAVSSAVKNGHVCFGKHFRYVLSHELPDDIHIHYISSRQIIELSKMLLDPNEIKNHI